MQVSESESLDIRPAENPAASHPNCSPGSFLQDSWRASLATAVHMAYLLHTWRFIIHRKKPPPC